MVYVDNMNAPFKRMIMCHLLADNSEELLTFIDKLGVDRKWIQNANTPYEHFDISLSKKKLAVELGAKEISFRELSLIMQNKMQNENE